jgi:hypothetical protein
MPVPDRVTADVEAFAALLIIESPPVASPATIGVNVTYRVALWPGSRLRGSDGAVLSAKPLPLAPRAVIRSVAFPVEETVMGCVAVVLRTTLPNGSVAG